MAEPTVEQILRLLREGTVAERVDFVERLPGASLSEPAAVLLRSAEPAQVVVALASVAQPYCVGANPSLGASLAAALHERGLELFRQNLAPGLAPMTLSGLAANHLRALAQLGRNEELLRHADRYVQLYGAEQENLPSLHVLRINALVNLERFDAAAQALGKQAALLDHPIHGIELKRLTRHVESARGSIFALPAQRTAQPVIPDPATLAKMVEYARREFADVGTEEQRAMLMTLLRDAGIDFTQLEDRQRALRTLDLAETMLTGGVISEQTVAGNIRRATSIFIQPTQSVEQLQSCLSQLTAALAWARQHAVTVLQNDALWGIYLCHSRLNDSSLAADTLISLRDNLESRRAGIQDPTQRAGVFAEFPHLFQALCMHLERARRPMDLLIAIEASKGRALADRLTAQTEQIVSDRAIYASVARLPALTRKHRFHYVSYLVDQDGIYAVLVDTRGEVRAAPVIPIAEVRLRSAAREVSPDRWGLLSYTRKRIPPTHRELAPVVAWLSELVDAGVLARDEQIVFCLDEGIHNVPLHYLEFRDGLLLDWFPISKVHSDTALHALLRASRAGSRLSSRSTGQQQLVAATRQLTSGTRMCSSISRAGLGKLSNSIRQGRCAMGRCELSAHRP